MRVNAARDAKILSEAHTIRRTMPCVLQLTLSFLIQTLRFRIRIDGRGQTSFLNNERIAYQTLLTEWQNRANNISNNSNLSIEAGMLKLS